MSSPLCVAAKLCIAGFHFLGVVALTLKHLVKASALRRVSRELVYIPQIQSQAFKSLQLASFIACDQLNFLNDASAGI